MERIALQRWWLPGLALAGAWLLVIRQVANAWTVVPQYNYGWFTPMLALVVWWGRFKTRPDPGNPPPRALVSMIAVGLILVLGPLRVIQEANRDWLFVSWAFALIATGLTLLAVLWLGGLPWMRHFLFPLLFPLVAVPWPSKIEQPIVHDLMAVVAQIAAEILTGSGIPAMARGNVIEIGRGLVGIDEACSGIQSFQSSVMVSLFVGEVFAFSRLARIGLFLGAIGWAFLCNIGRTLFLSLVCYREGFDAIDRYHDTAGVVVMVICYAGIIGLAMFMGRHVPQPTPTQPAASPRRFSPTLCAVGLIWVLTAEVGTLTWFARQAETYKAKEAWTVELKQGQLEFHSREFSGRERTILRYNEGSSATWKSPEGRRWECSFIRWEPGNLAVNMAKHHNPTICLVGSGWELDQEYPTRTYNLAGYQIPFRSFRFSQKKKEIISFFCLWDDVDRPPADQNWKWSTDQWSARYRLQNALAGKRTTGIQLLNASVEGHQDWEAASKEFAAILEKIGIKR